MWEDGVQIMRENLRRRSPNASEDEIEDQLAGPDPAAFDRSDLDHLRAATK